MILKGALSSSFQNSTTPKILVERRAGNYFFVCPFNFFLSQIFHRLCVFCLFDLSIHCISTKILPLEYSIAPQNSEAAVVPHSWKNLLPCRTVFFRSDFYTVRLLKVIVVRGPPAAFGHVGAAPVVPRVFRGAATAAAASTSWPVSLLVLVAVGRSASPLCLP